jgi:di/tricarboxylate transporter
MQHLPEIVSIVVLALMFVIATVRGINMGVLGFIAAAAVGGLVLGMTADEYLAGFPIDLFVTLLGLTFLFGFAQQNGAIEVVVHAAMRLLRGRVQLAPWVFFVLTAALIAVGALFAVAIVTPLAMAFARRYRLNLLMTGLMVVHGALAGAFSPLSVYGVFVNGFLASNGFEPQPLTLFLAPLIANTLFAAAVFLVLHRRPGLGAPAAGSFGFVAGRPGAAETAGLAGTDAAADLAGSGEVAGLARGATVVGADAGAGLAGDAARLREAAPRIRPTGIQTLTLVGLVVMVVGVVGFGLEIGVLSLIVGAVIGIVRPKDAGAALAKVSWSVVVLIGGVLTYIAVLEAAGTVEWVSSGIGAIGVPLVAALLLFYLAGIVSALASSLGIIGVVLALSLPFLQEGSVELGGFIAGLAFAATIVDISPFSTNGAMLLAGVDASVRDRFYRQMLVYAGLMVAIGPGVGWLLAAVPTWLAG